MRKLTVLFSILMLLMLAITPAFAQENAAPAGNIAEVAQAAGSFETLLAAADAAGLVGALTDPAADLTVFAPTDAAFNAALRSLGLTADELLQDTFTLQQILLYHVIPGQLLAQDLVDANLVTLQGETIAIDVAEDGSVTVNGADVVTPNVDANNGLIHVIDAVLLPPTYVGYLNAEAPAPAPQSIAALAAGNPNLSTLLAAVEAADLGGALADPALDATVFAPTNAAFSAALNALGITADELFANTELLQSILLYHVMPGTFFAEDLVTDNRPSLQGEPIMISVDEDGNVQVNQANVIIADVDASNGIVHVIDAVILPPSVAAALGLGN